MMRRIWFGLLCLVMLIATSAFAAMPPGHTSTFDLNKANQQFEQINAKISGQNLKIKELSEAANALESLKADAEGCVQSAEDQLDAIAELIKTSKIEKNALNESVAFQFLKKKQGVFQKQYAECRLFVLHAEDAIRVLKAAILSISTKRTLSKSTPVWRLFDRNVIMGVNQFDAETFYQDSGFLDLTYATNWALTGLFCIGLLLGYYLSVIFKAWIDTARGAGRILMAELFQSLRSYAMPILAIFLPLFYLNNKMWQFVPMPLLLVFFNGLFIVLLFSLALSIFSFQLSRKYCDQLYHSGLAITVWVFVGYFAQAVMLEQPVSIEFIDILRAFFIIVLSLLTGIFLSIFLKFDRLKQFGSVFLSSIRFALYAIIAVTLISEVLGFHRLALFIVEGILHTIVAILLAVVIAWFVKKSILSIDQSTSPFSERVHAFFDLGRNRKLNELIILRFAIYVFLFFFLIIFLLETWGVSKNLIDQLTESAFHGVKLSGHTLVPVNILWAAIVFVFLSLTVRFISARISKKHRGLSQVSRQVALASIVNYAGMAIALLIAMLIAGVNFTGLAIIAGALSVGVGFGLQNIVNDFVSGIILLLEKPIKPGDRVIVGNVEGFVKKVRIRSTQISTLAHEDVIVPNGDLVSKQVVNYMFRDQKWRVECKIGVAYGTNVERVKQILLDVANDHPQIHHSEPNAPSVLFQNFGESNLEFELWCIIRDVNLKYQIRSDLYFAIEKAFKREGIVVAFPQRDVHLK